jgi:hypothetical protein
MIRGPFFFRLLLEFRGELLDLRPCLLAILQEERCVEFDTAGDLQLCGFTVLVANLGGVLGWIRFECDMGVTSHIARTS